MNMGGICFMFFCGVVSLIVKRNHLLMSLMSLEFISVSMFIFFVVLGGGSNMNLCISIYFLVLAACEGALGLGVVVGIVSGYGGDMFSSVVSVQC